MTEKKSPAGLAAGGGVGEGDDGSHSASDDTRSVDGCQVGGAPRALSLSEVSGFTPVIDDLVLDPEIGVIGALVYGATWRMTQRGDRACSARIETIAQMVGLGTRTVRRYLKALSKRGWLINVSICATPCVKSVASSSFVPNFR